MRRFGIDTGGTFTDFVRFDPEGMAVYKVRSTPEDPARAVLQGLAELGGAAAAEIVHGSTVATNAVLERKGARIALVATAGFEDVLPIGRQTRRELYNLFVEGRRPLVPSELTFGVRERVTADGTVLTPLDPAEIDALAARLVHCGVESVAVCFLHSYANSVHEELAAARLQAAGLTVSASHQVLPEYREFERWSTTALDAYVTPLVGRYLARLAAALEGARLWVMQSNGGTLSAEAACRRAVQTLLSGPAAGVVGARTVARLAGCRRLISFDMGGTSTDVSLVDGDLNFTAESTVGEFPLRLPVVDIHTVGAGGGSIAWVDRGGALRVGPESAGADPGPVCYGRGTALTVTDANLLLGRLDPTTLLGGRLQLDVERTREAARAFAATLGTNEVALAEAIVRVANANMERALRVVSVERGVDPRDLTLVAFGGAGGMHACDLASRLQMRRILVPRYAGVLSALGLLVADVTRDYSRTLLRPVAELTKEELETAFAPLTAQAQAELARDGFRGDRAVLTRAVDVRYIGQSYEITVPFGPKFRAAFDRRHARLYGYADPRRGAEVVTLRVRATGLTSKPDLPRAPIRRARAAEPSRVVPAWFDGRKIPTPVYRWETLGPGVHGEGPALVAGGEATAVVAPGFRFEVDSFGNLLIVGAAGRRHPARGARAARRR
jgi:N-methylhydantoinase A/oxoprolinase/acetone carboxylase beta subunit